MSDDLEAWLAAALRDADPARRARLRAEILDHLAEAQASYRGRGLDASAARAAALADLGDPKATARALRRELPRPRWPRLALPRGGRGLVLLMGVMLLLAVMSLRRPFALGAAGELAPDAGMALLLQVAALTLALCLPLRFDDLDLSTGAVVLLGAYLVRAPGAGGGQEFWLTANPDALPWALLGAGLAGAAVGLLHGLLTIALRRPAALVTLVGGGTLAALMLAQPGASQLPLSSGTRLPTLLPTLVLFGAACAVLLLVSLSTRSPAARTAAPAPRLRLSQLTLLAWALFPITLTLGLVRLTWGSPAAVLLLACVAGGSLWVLGRARQPGGDQGRIVVRSTVRRAALMLGLAMAGAAVVGMQSPAGLGNYPVQLLLLTPLAGLVALALAVIAAACHDGRGRAWVTSEERRGMSPLTRIVALALGSGLAAAIGGCVGAQGIRDGTPVHAMAFYMVVPLAGLIVGGQHWLPPALRLPGALLGALVVAGLTPLGGDNLDTAAPALLLAALSAVAWHRAVPPGGALADVDATVDAVPPDQAEHHLLTG